MKSWYGWEVAGAMGVGQWAWRVAVGVSLTLAMSCSVDSRQVSSASDPDEATARLGGGAGTASTSVPGSLMDGAGGSVPPASDGDRGDPGTALPTTMGSGSAGNGSAGSGSADGAGNGSPPPPSGGSCQGQALPSSTGPANVLLLVDRSTSMLEPVDETVPGGPSRWDAVTAGLRSFLDLEQTGIARVGLQFFGLTNGRDDCSIDKYRVPAVAVAPIAGNRATLLTTLDATQPGSLTPAAPALTGALEYSLQLAQRPENAGIPGVVILFLDGVPSECGTTVGPDGVSLVRLSDLIDPLQRFAQPPRDASNNPTQPPIRTFLVGFQPAINALAQAGSGQQFVIGAADAAGGNTAASDRIAEALHRVLARPLACELDLPASAPGSNEPLDGERVRVKLRTADGVTNELVRTAGPGACTEFPAWHYADAQRPGKISLCPSACALMGSADVQLEFGCAPQRAP